MTRRSRDSRPGRFALTSHLIEVSPVHRARYAWTVAVIVSLASLAGGCGSPAEDVTGTAVATVPSIGSSASPTSDGASASVLAFMSPGGLFVINADGSDPRQLADIGGGEGGGPAWSPDGEWIAFASALNMANPNDNDIYVIRADGAELRNISNDEYRNVNPAWSPDGKRIVYNRGVRLMVAESDGSAARYLVDDESVPYGQYGPSWSPDGHFVAFSTATGETYVVKADGSGLRELTPPDQTEWESFNGSPVWSPDGQQLVLTAWANEGLDLDVVVVNVDGSEPRSVSSATGSRDYWPSWSPNGHLIAFVSDVDEKRIIFVTAVDDPNPQPVSPDWIRAGPPVWSPDGSSIAFVGNHDEHDWSDCGGDWRVSIVPLGGSRDPIMTIDSICGSGVSWKPEPTSP
jgi:Tol biopolymer transport system component